MDNLKYHLHKIAERNNLTRQESRDAFNLLMSGEATPAQIGAFLMGLRVKGEALEEAIGAVEVMRSKMTPVKAPSDAMDIVGTGGDGLGTYNISTCTAFVTAAAGIPIAKHGNKALSSRSGAADVLTELGLSLDLSPEGIATCIQEAGIGFMFAPNHHKAMRFVAPARVELGTRTLFNMLGPLSNPANVKKALIGVYSRELVRPVAQILQALGNTDVIVMHGADGLDEITTTGESYYAQLQNGVISEDIFTPEQVGIQRVNIEALKGGTPQDNAVALKKVLQNEASPYLDIVLMNAGAALIVAGKASDLKEGVTTARDLIASGKAYQKLEELITLSAQLFEQEQELKA